MAESKERGGSQAPASILRHTFVTEMLRAGVPRTVTMAITDMNERYEVIEEWEKAEATKKSQGVSGRILPILLSRKT